MSRKGIILLTLVGLFTYLSWIALIPFVSDLYILKQERSLLFELEGTLLSREEKSLIERERQLINERLGEGALEKAKRSLTLFTHLPFFAKLLFGCTFLLMLMLLREVPESEKALFLLPLLALLLFFTLPKTLPSKRELLYPAESSFPKEAFSSKEAWEQAWNSYLKERWRGDLLRFQLHLVQEAPLSKEPKKPLIGSLLTLFFLFWTGYSSYQLNRRSAS